MIDPTRRAEDLESDLAEIDRRLSQIQDELSEAEPSAAPPPSRTARAERARRHGRSGPLAAVLQRAARTAAPSRPRGPARAGALGSPAGAGRPRPTRGSRAPAARSGGPPRHAAGFDPSAGRGLPGRSPGATGHLAARERRPGATVEAPEITVSAGPFAATSTQLRAFERALAELPGVREIVGARVRGQSTGAIVDVRLDDDRSSPSSARTSVVSAVMTKPISFARGAPSLDIVDVDGLRAAADRAFADDPGGMTALRHRRSAIRHCARGSPSGTASSPST